MACVGCTDTINCPELLFSPSFTASQRRKQQYRKPTPLHAMISLRAALLATFLLAVSYQYATAKPHTPTECCFSYVTDPIRFDKLVDFYRTPKDCPFEAIVLQTRAEREVCADPSKLWVQIAMKRLARKKKGISQAEQSR